MRSHTSIRAGLVLALTLATGIVADAQTNWPTARPRAAAPVTTVKSRKPARRRRIARLRPVAAAVTPENDLLRSMAELITRQAAAIELLERRLAAAESRLAALAPAEPEVPAVAVNEDPQAPFRAATLAIDWADLLSR